MLVNKGIDIMANLTGCYMKERLGGAIDTECIEGREKIKSPDLVFDNALLVGGLDPWDVTYTKEDPIDRSRFVIKAAPDASFMATCHIAETKTIPKFAMVKGLEKDVGVVPYVLECRMLNKNAEAPWQKECKLGATHGWVIDFNDPGFGGKVPLVDASDPAFARIVNAPECAVKP
jgi:hypothetical protein